MASWTVARTARKRHRCNDYRCPNWIEPGQRYLAFTYSPQHDDIGNTSWLRYKQCRSCVTQYGRGDLLDPKGSTQ